MNDQPAFNALFREGDIQQHTLGTAATIASFLDGHIAFKQSSTG